MPPESNGNSFGLDGSLGMDDPFTKTMPLLIQQGIAACQVNGPPLNR